MIRLCVAVLAWTLALLAAPLRADAPLALFDGKSLSGWTTVAGTPVEKGWDVVDGALHCSGKDRIDIVTIRTFADFDLTFEWKTTPGTNSGVKYRFGAYAPDRVVGPEFQILDAPSEPIHATGSLYDLFAPDPSVAQKPAGKWNRGRIVARGDRIEHFVNGKRTLLVTRGTAAWRAALGASKFSDLPDFAARPGKVMLQDHGHEVWFRNLQIIPR